MNDFTTLMTQLFTSGKFGHIDVTNFFINFLFVWVIVHFLYFRKSRHRSFYFTYLMLGVAIYFLVYFMVFVLEDLKGKTGIGVGIGLFGIFSIMRFRTDAMPVREMTYLFLIISLSVISAISGDKDDFDWARISELVITDAIVILITWLCEHRLKVKATKLIQYDRIELATPQRYAEMLDDLKKRTGLDIIKVDVGGMDFLKDCVVLKVYYNPPTGESSNAVNEQFKIRQSQFREV